MLKSLGYWLIGLDYDESMRIKEMHERYRYAGQHGYTGGQIYTIVNTRLCVSEFLKFLEPYCLAEWVETYEEMGNNLKRVFWNCHGEDSYKKLRPLLDKVVSWKF